MHALSNAFKTFAPMLIEPAKANAYLEKVTSVNLTDMKAGEDMDDMLEMLFGPRPELVKSSSVAVIPVKGVIGSNLTELEKMMGAVDVEDIEEMVEDAERDANIKVIIFDFNSPGGTVTGVPELGRRIRRCAKRTVGWTCSQSCSGSMWLMSQCDEVFCSPSSTVGSIGVYIAVMDISIMYEGEGISLDLIKAGWAKAAGYPGTKMTPEQRKLYQDDVDEMHGWFIADVSAVRTYAKAEDMQGQCWSGKKAATKALVSGLLDTFDDLLKHLGEDIYEEFEGAESKVPSAGAGYAMAAKADVTPEQGDKDEVSPISEKKKKKKKKKEDGSDSDEDEEDDIDEEVPEKDCPPIETDQQKV